MVWRQPINPFTGAAITLADVSGLSYVPSANSPALRAYSAVYHQSTFSNSKVSAITHQYYLSPDWLGATTRYNVPNLATVTGFNPAWSLQTGVQTYSGVDSVMGNIPISELAKYWLYPSTGIPGMQMQTAGSQATLIP